jgi:hypothetical protein
MEKGWKAAIFHLKRVKNRERQGKYIKQTT